MLSLKLLTFAGIIASSIAYAPCMSLNRRELVQAGTAALGASPFLETLPASARAPKKPKPTPITFPWQDKKAPMITIFDHTGCNRPRTEYKGKMSNTADDERCIKFYMREIVYEDELVRKFNIDRLAQYGSKYQDLVVTGYNGLYTPSQVGKGLLHPEDSDYCKAGGSDCASAVAAKEAEAAAKAAALAAKK